MRTARRHAAALVAGVLLAGCMQTPSPVDHGSAQPERPGVVVLLHGSAFAAAGTRDDAVQAVRELTGRPAHAIVEEPPVEPVLQSAAARLDKSVARAARADIRDAACRKK